MLSGHSHCPVTWSQEVLKASQLHSGGMEINQWSRVREKIRRVDDIDREKE